jgi:hypothetical protein
MSNRIYKTKHIMKERNYKTFLATKKKSHISSGFKIDISCLSDHLFDFQKFAVKWALELGRSALFEDCGLGKTIQMLEWSMQVNKNTNKPVLILAPLAVVGQTKQEALKFYNYELVTSGSNLKHHGVEITNYEQIDNIDCSQFAGVVLDESSILKGKDSKTKNKLLDYFKNTPYKLCCTATPSPNDHMELGNHSEFLGSMSYLEMLAMYFVHDGGETSKWRLRKHAENNFWEFVSSWGLAIDNPSTLGFNEKDYNLPEINFIEHLVNVESDGLDLFGESIVSATELHRDLKKSQKERIKTALNIYNNKPNDQWIFWVLGNEEAKELQKTIPNSVNVHGGLTAQQKADYLLGFANGTVKNLITKTSIASFGMNYQNACNMCFTSYDFKFEAFYQAVRREYRFGQERPVNVHLIIPKSQVNVRKSILEKESKHKEMMHKMSLNSAKFNQFKRVINPQADVKTSNYWLMNGDCVERSKEIPDNELDLVVFSPPFAELYVYSDKEEDMGNVKNYKEFEEHFKYLVPHIKRTLKPGRICAVHCMDLPIQKGKEGYIGLRDFSGMLKDLFVEQGFIYHARTTIWKNPVTEMQRTKALGLLHKTIKKDSVMSRVGIPDYVLFFRNEGDNEIPITHQDVDQNKPDYLPVDLWQKYASPVWYDIDYGRTLQYRSGRDGNDEKHICPLQLDTINRILHLYSNEGETVGSFFGGIGSEGFESIKMNRKSVSIELKESYFALNKKNHESATKEKSVLSLF